jgi:uncharacterized protein (UPF0332 family)
VKPETADYSEKARHCLAGAGTIAEAGLPDVAAREAYLAAYHAAEAYIFERTDKAAKTHRGVRGQFGRLARQEAGIKREFLTFLAEGYEIQDHRRLRHRFRDRRSLARRRGFRD